MIDKSEEHFLRIVLLLMKYGGEVLRHLIEYELRIQKWQTVSDFLSERNHEILHLTFESKDTCCQTDCIIPSKSSGVLSRDFLNVMYQNMERWCKSGFKYYCSCYMTPKTDLDMSSWDITLTCRLLLEFIIKDPCQRQVIFNLRNYRNSKELFHSGQPRMDEHVFRKTWIKVADAIKEVAEKCEPFYLGPISKEIDQLKNGSLTQRDFIELDFFLKKINKSDDPSHIKDDISKLSHLISKLALKLEEDSTVSTEMENLAYFTERCLQEHEKKMYIEPRRAMSHSLKHLEDYQTIFIIGDAGSGKTRFCLQLMTKFLKKYQDKSQDLTPLILTDSSQWTKIKFDKKYIVLIDDIVGKSNLNARAFDNWSTVFDLMKSRLDSVFIIFALRSCIWELKKDGFNDFTLFSVQNPVDLSGSEFGLTSEEKLLMLQRFSALSEKKIASCGHETPCISLKDLKLIAKMQLTKGFPYLCESFFSSKESLEMGSKFFKGHTANSYEKERIDLMLGEKRYLQYVILVFMFLSDKCYTKNEIRNSRKDIACLAKNVFDINPKQVTKPEIIQCVHEMQDVFINISDDTLKLKHMVTYEAVLMSFGENFPEVFLESINKTVLFAYVRSNGYVAKENEVVVQLDSDMTELLAWKLLDVYGSDRNEAYMDVYKHPSFYDSNLVDCFLSIVEKDKYFKTFLHSFVAGACNDKKDVLARETIRRFSCSYEFDIQTFHIVVNLDLILTCSQFFGNIQFRKCLFVQSNGIIRLWFFFSKACCEGSLQCAKALLNIYKKGSDLEVDGNPAAFLKPCPLEKIPINMILAHPFVYNAGNDSCEMLIQLDDLLHVNPEEKQYFYQRIILNSLELFHCRKSDIALKYLDKINPLTSFLVEEVMICVFVHSNTDDFFHALCSKMQGEKFELDPKTAAEISICCAQWKKDEKMFLTLLNHIKCDFTVVEVVGETILHACESSGFSSSTLIKLLKRPEGPQMFTSENLEGRTPVQCRVSYINTKDSEDSSENPNNKGAKKYQRTFHRHRCSSFKRPGEHGTLLHLRQRRRESFSESLPLKIALKRKKLYLDALRSFRFRKMIDLSGYKNTEAYCTRIKDYRDDTLIAYTSLKGEEL